LRGSRVAWAAPEMVPSRAARRVSGTRLPLLPRSHPDAGKDGVMLLAATLDVPCASTMCRSSPRALPPIWRETECGAPELKEVSPGRSTTSCRSWSRFPPPRSGSCALNHSSPWTGRPRRCCVLGQAAEADAFLTERAAFWTAAGRATITTALAPAALFRPAGECPGSSVGRALY
jgi:hypothetical protein